MIRGAESEHRQGCLCYRGTLDGFPHALQARWDAWETMRILCPIKRVIDPYAKVKPNAAGTAIETSAVKFEINPFDEIALEEAARIKERDPAAEIIAVTIGGTECEDQLRKALAMGADRGILIECDTPLAPPSIATELAALVAELAPDLILAGKQSTDGDNNQAAQMLAALLDWPQATFASKLEIDGEAVRVTRETDGGEETLEMSLPCVVTTDLRLNEPRYIALPGIIRARSKPLDRRPPATSQAPRSRITAVEAPPARAPGRKVGSAEELLAALREKGVLA